jgi:hypothetical protein
VRIVSALRVKGLKHTNASVLLVRIRILHTFLSTYIHISFVLFVFVVRAKSEGAQNSPQSKQLFRV